MNRLRSQMILAVLLFALSSRPAHAQSVLQRCEPMMADAESMAKQVGLCADALPALVEPMAGELIAYAALNAYASGDVGACALQPLASWVDGCRESFLEMTATRAAVGPAAGYIAACRQTDQSTKPDKVKKKEQCCTLVAGGIGRPNACAGMVPLCGADLGYCQAYMSSLNGDAANCKNLVAGNADGCVSADTCRREQENCRGTALFVKAHKAKNILLCGTSDYCRVLMGEGKTVVQERRAQLLKNPQGRWYVNREWKPGGGQSEAGVPKLVTNIKGFSCEKPVGAGGNRQATAAVLSAARSCLSFVESALSRPSLETSQKIDEQEEKLARIALRLNGYFTGASAPAKPAKTRVE